MNSDEFSKLLSSFNSNSSYNIKTHRQTHKYNIRYVKKTPPQTNPNNISYFSRFENGIIQKLTFNDFTRISKSIDSIPNLYSNIQIFKINKKITLRSFNKLLTQNNKEIILILDRTIPNNTS